MDLLGGPVVRNPPFNAGFDPWSGKIPHAAEQLSMCAKPPSPCALESVLHNKSSHHNEKTREEAEELVAAKNTKPLWISSRSSLQMGWGVLLLGQKNNYRAMS